MSNFATDYKKRTKEKQTNLEELSGHIRAIEAILLEVAGPDTMRAAKERHRKTCKDNDQWASIYDEFGMPYDKHAEAALDGLIREAESKNS
jgi:hypothetical protein